MTAAPIFGLQWLLNSPRFEITTIGEDGLSVPISTFDPRAFALHKLWLSQREDRDPIKVNRDRDQAAIIAEISTKYLGMKFDSKDLKALPQKLRDFIAKLTV